MPEYFVGRRQGDYRYRVYRLTKNNQGFEKVWSGDNYDDALIYQGVANDKLRHAERELTGGRPTRLDKIRELEQAKLEAWNRSCNDRR